MTTVKLKGLRKAFGETIAVENLDLEVKDKEVVCLLGPSGCGKTTTLNCIAGLESPTRGTIYFDDVPVNDMPAKDRGVGLVFQSYALFHHMTARENLAFPLLIRKVPKEQIEREIESISEFLNLELLLDTKTGKMSLNQRQRVAIGRTLLSKPKILLLDEPLSALDAVTRIHVRGELKKLIKDTQQTTIYVTHDQLEAMALADRIAVMSKGLLQQYGKPQEVYDHPKNKFVANFVGSPSINFLECSLEKKGDMIFLAHEAFNYNVTEYRAEIIENASGSELILGIRPEHILVAQQPTGDAIKATIDIVEPLGFETLLDLRVGKDVVRANVPSLVKAERGDSIYIEFNQAGVHIFDKKTETAII